MKDILYEMANNINNYYGNAIFLIISVFSYLYLYSHDKKCRKRLVYPVALIAFCLINPVLYYFVYRNVVYWRLLWMLPNTLVIAYAVTRITQNCDKKLEKSIVIVIVILLVTIKGTNVYKNGVFIKTQNWQKLSNDTKEICDLLLEMDSSPKCIMPAGIFSEVRQYSGEIRMLYGRDADNYIMETDSFQKTVSSELQLASPNYGYIMDIAKKKGYNYIITYADRPADKMILDECGFRKVAQTERYLVYFCAYAKEKDAGWIITQYGNSPAQNNAMCYTIEDKKDNLIVIDGGCGWRTWNLSEKAKEYNNHIKAWIMTIPFDGELGFFEHILQDMGLVIDNFYVFEADMQEFQEKADSIECYYTYNVFLNFMKEYPYVHYIKNGDKFEMSGLSVRILSTGNSNRDTVASSHYNMGSLGFVIQGEKESMLFCSDIRATMDSSLMEIYGNELDVDYVQFSFRDWNNISLEFIKQVSPKVIFIDSLESMTGQFEKNGWASYLNESRIKIFEKTSRINGIILK